MPVNEWNVVVRVKTQGFRQALEVLREFGAVDRTDFYNVLAMRAGDVPSMLETLRKRLLADPGYLGFLSRLIPVTDTFVFQTPGEFEERAGAIVRKWVPELGGKGFHVRMHRRGFRGKLSGLDEERFLDRVLLEALEEAGTPGRVTFEDPDVVVVVETITQWAGLAFWGRGDLERYPFIRPE